MALDKAEAVEEAEFVLNLLDGAELDYPIFSTGRTSRRGADGRHGLGHADGVRRGVLQACGAKWLSKRVCISTSGSALRNLICGFAGLASCGWRNMRVAELPVSF